MGFVPSRLWVVALVASTLSGCEFPGLATCNDCSLSVLPIEHGRVTLVLKADGVVIAASEACGDFEQDQPQIVSLRALNGAFVAPVEVTSRVAGMATLSLAYDLNRITLNGAPVGSEVGTVQWARFLGANAQQLALQGLGMRVLHQTEIRGVQYALEVNFFETVEACR